MTKQIIEGLEDAVRGNISYVYINGQHWKRIPIEDMPPTELRLHELQNKIAELTTALDVRQARIDELVIENRTVHVELRLVGQLLAECKDQLAKNIAILTEVREQLAVKAL